ncbi:MAG TPA: choice-of-anchor tandem repeat GloVer-containing protein [Rhizomicrobium sp.]|jgi:uncharacterized repeat protein (TIGR03803 family)
MSPSRYLTMLPMAAFALGLCAGGVQAKGKFTVLHNFAGGDGDGANPYGGVAPDGHGNFYVATDQGGPQNDGVLARISSKGAETILHGFTGNSDGQNADGALFVGSDGLAFGATRFGGTFGCGTIYRYARVGGYRKQNDFACASNGDLAFPFAAQTPSAQFGIIGTATNGNSGTSGDDGGFYYLYHGVEEPICQFHGSDGSQPYGGVVEIQLDSEYDYYIAASTGGSSNLGTITLFDSSCNSRVLHNFAGGNDGATPFGALWSNNDFFLYGTTRLGGANNLGTVFRMDVSGGNYAILHTFQGICCGYSDGSFPAAGLTMNPKDKMLYGVTINGGNASDSGTIFKIDPSTGGETVVHAFRGGDGAHPYAGLYIDAKGRVYGTTLQGGTNNLGVVFELKT